MSSFGECPPDHSAAELYEMECDHADRERKALQEDEWDRSLQEAIESGQMTDEQAAIEREAREEMHRASDPVSIAQEEWQEFHRPEPDEYPRGAA